MSYDFELVCTLPASPEAVYEAWLNSAAHSRMTGGDAKVSKRLGAAFSAWDGYITGKNVELVPGRKIVQTWRTAEFAEGDPDSIVTLTLEPAKSGVRLTLSHTGVPDGQTSYEDHGWRENYFEPMMAYFAGQSKSEPREKDV
jgi:uncharacterized protein YndB with AHSA1/START domain